MSRFKGKSFRVPMLNKAIKENCRSLGNGVYEAPNGMRIIIASEDTTEGLRGLTVHQCSYYSDTDTEVLDLQILERLKRKLDPDSNKD